MIWIWVFFMLLCLLMKVVFERTGHVDKAIISATGCIVVLGIGMTTIGLSASVLHFSSNSLGIIVGGLINAIIGIGILWTFTMPLMRLIMPQKRTRSNDEESIDR